MLKRKTCFKPRKAGLPKKSKARGQQQAAQRRAYGEAEDAEQCWCSCCGVTGERLEHSHLLTQKAHPEHRNNPLNWLLKCRTCRSLYEDNKRRFAAYYPAAWLLILLRIQQHFPEAYERFRHKNPY